MTIRFERPVGSHLDLRELEYISALHQTGAELRSDASVTVEDVVYFLASRHGINADLNFVKERLMPDLAGALEEDEEEPVFDMVELVSIILIPHFLKEGNRDLFRQVMNMILLDTMNGDMDNTPKYLDRDFVRQLLEFYGETNVPQGAIDDMLHAAGAKEGVDGEMRIEFTPEALQRATTFDLKKYSTDWDHSATTHFDDAFYGTTLHFATPGNTFTEANDTVLPKTDCSKGEPEKSKPKMTRIITFSSVDYIAENFRSVYFTIILWVTVVLAYFAYIAEINLVLGHLECDRYSSDVGCRMANAIIAWLSIFAQLSILGTSFLFLASAGNSIYVKRGIASFAYVFVGIATIAICCIFSYAYRVEVFFANTDTDDTSVDNFLTILTLILGAILICFQIKVLVFVFLPKQWYRSMPTIQRFFVSGMARAEMKTKQAAAWKTEKMVQNALQLHNYEWATRSNTRISATYGHAMLAYNATVDEREPCGGLLWTFQRLWDGTLFIQEGVWLHTRLIASNFSQYFVAFFVLALFAVIYRESQINDETSPSPAPSPTVSPAPTQDPLSVEADTWVLLSLPLIIRLTGGNKSAFANYFWDKVGSNATIEIGGDLLDSTSDATLKGIMESLNPDTLQDIVAQGTFLLSNGSLRRLEEDDDESFQEYITPETWMVNLSLAAGGLTAFVSALALAIVWIPSAVSSILRFRSGCIGSLRDKHFQKYREAPDLTSIIFGSTFWGSIVSSLVLFVFVGGIIFLVVWEPTREVVLLFISQIIGITVTLLAKVLVLMVIRKIIFVGLFRKNPASCNITMLVLESWSLGLTVGTVLARLMKLIAVAAFYVGRLDTPLFAPGVGMIGNIPLDTYPIQFRKDLIVHDAHRHPYMERLGVIYMLKLRYGEEFAKPVGSAWRLIFVMALMPWLRRFRLTNTDIEENEDVEMSEDLQTIPHDSGSTPNEVEGAQALAKEVAQLRKRTLELERQNASLRKKLEKQPLQEIELSISEDSC